MKICWITSYPPKQSGIANYSEDIVTEMQKLEKVDIFLWNYEGLVIKLFAPLVNLWRLRRVMRDYDIVHIQYVLGENMPLFLPVVCILKGKAKVVITSHEDYRNLPFARLFILFHNIFYLCADRMMVHTRYHRELFWKSLQKRTVIIPFGTESFPQVKTKKHTVLMQGFINTWKGHDLAVQAISIVRESVPDVVLIIAGKIHNRRYWKSVERKIKELGIEHNVDLMTGFIPTNVFQRLIAQSEIVVMPYKRITMSAILSDVVGHAKPCVLSDLPSFRDYTKGKAIYFKAGDSNDLARKLSALLRSDADKKKMIRFFQKLAGEYSWPMIAKLTLESYGKIVRR